MMKSCQSFFLAVAVFLTSNLALAHFNWIIAASDTQVDNSSLNKRDAAGTTLTPENQAMTSSQDVEFTRRIRQLIVADKTLSVDAHNVKIITVNGVATLRGPVENSRERRSLENWAGKIVGRSSVRNELQVLRR